MPDFNGLRVLSLESRRADEMARLIASQGGVPTVAPSMREVPLESNTQALAFASKLFDGGFDMVLFLTGVGTRALARVIETVHPRERFVDALKRVAVVVRGPKPAAALREMGVPITLHVPEPNTWHEVLSALDQNAATLPIAGRRVAVQEYGVSNPELLAGLTGRGAIVTRVPVYQWAPPEDTGPLRAAAASLARGEFDVVVFTTSVQVDHLLAMAREDGLEDGVRRALKGVVVASIGPTTSEALREQGISPDFEPSHPKMGFLVKEAAQRSAGLLARKRATVH